MARRRYLSSAISTDKLVNRLALEAGDFAALLYTWMIPHAADNATLTGDPEELLMQVFPGRRDKQPQDIVDALTAMVNFGLISWDDDHIRFPPSFYKHQSYISADRRDVAEIAQDAAEQRKVAQNATSFKSSFSSSFKQQQAAVAHAREKPPPSLYADILNGALPKLESMFQGIDQLFTPAWLAKELADAAAVIGPLSREQLGRGLDIAVKQIERQMAAKTVRNPRPFAHKLIVDYLTEQRDEHHAA